MHRLNTTARFQEIKSLCKERDALLRQLDESLAIQQLWLQAFDCGKCTSQLVGNLLEPDTLVLRIRRSDGEIRDFSIWDVPKCLRDRHLEKHIAEAPYGKPWKIKMRRRCAVADEKSAGKGSS